MLKLASCCVLASLRGSTYRKAYAFAPSLAAALQEDQFEHPEEQGKLLDGLSIGGARSTGAEKPARVPFQRRGNEQAWKEYSYVAALRDERFEHPGPQLLVLRHFTVDLPATRLYKQLPK